MQIIWLGQGGFLFVSDRKKILIDPYLSDSMRLIDKAFKRRSKINKKLLRIKPDIIILTNSHPDHTDQKTLSKLLKKKAKKKITVLACENAFASCFKSRDFARADPTVFGEGDEWTLDCLRIKAVKARTSDPSAFGVLITDTHDGKCYYVASSTLYNESIISSLPKDIFASFIPISGTHGNMNMADAIRFADKIDSEFNVPINYGMFDSIDPTEFKVKGKVFPRANKVIEFNILPIQSLFSPKVLDSKFNEKKKVEKITAKKSPASHPTKNEEKKPYVSPICEDKATIVIEDDENTEIPTTPSKK